jgi:Na+/proline symporter
VDLTFTWYEYVIVGGYIAVILGIGIFLSRKGSENVDEYFLGGKSMPWWVLGISFMTSNLDLTGTMVIASFFSMVGLKGFLVELRGGTALPLAMFMIFMAKWHRRAGVMTIAEWMEFRFGEGSGARAARLVSAIGVIILVVGMMTYFCVGFGKFLSLYFPFSPTMCTVLFTGVATMHILFSGLYGVVFTDVIQGFLILVTVVVIAWMAVTADVAPDTLQQAWTSLGQPNMTWEQWTSITPTWHMEFLTFWVLRIFLEGFGGPLVPYASQRFFAARTDKEASLTTASSLAMFVIRWPLVIGIAVLGLGLGAGIPSDPEMVFPAVLGHYFPLGLRAVIVSCMIAAAMSTFDSTVNAGGAYIVNDIYRRFLKPEATQRQLIHVSWAATIGLTVVSIGLASTITSINEIWSWLSMGFFGGLALPMIVRWYWERLNGWGYTVGTVVGISAAIAQKALWPELDEWAQLGLIGALSFAACVVATYATAPVSTDTLVTFYRRTRPIGRWPRARAELSDAERRTIRREHRFDMLSIIPAFALFFFLFLCPMYLIVHEWPMVIASLAVVAACAGILYFTWYRPLDE